MNEPNTGVIVKRLRAYYALPFKALAIGIRIFMANRAWLEERLSRRGATGSMKGIIVITLLVWLLIWLFTEDSNRNNLNQTLETIWSGFAK